MSLLVWVKSKKVFLKIQEGTGDNLSAEDISEGFRDYVLWSTFRPCDIDLDETLDVELVDSGMAMSKNYPYHAAESIKDCYLQAFDEAFSKKDIVVLL